MGQKRDIYILVIFQTLEGLWLSEDQSQWALVIKQATVLCNLVLLPFIPCINLVGGLSYLSAFLVIDILIIVKRGLGRF